MDVWIVRCSVCQAEFEMERPAMPVYEFDIPDHEFRDKDGEPMPGVPCQGSARPGVAIRSKTPRRTAQ
jgi:hypothetical protein